MVLKVPRLKSCERLAHFDRSVLVDAVSFEVVLVVLEIPHHNFLPKIKVYLPLYSD